MYRSLFTRPSNSKMLKHNTLSKRNCSTQPLTTPAKSNFNALMANLDTILDEKQSKQERALIITSLFHNVHVHLWEERESKLMKLQQQLSAERENKLEEKNKEIRSLDSNITQLTRDKAELNLKLLMARGKCNLRGAVELCRHLIAVRIKNTDLAEPIDKTLQRLEGDATFMTTLKNGCTKLNLREDDVKKCLGGLYHNLSKDHHGVDGEVAIFEKDWVPGERVALICLFQHCNMPFTYYDMASIRTTPPF